MTLQDEIAALSHAVQSGVAYEMERDDHATQPKHLRTGVNMAMVEHAALVKLLVDAGIITMEHYLVELRDQLLLEVARYEKRLSALFGANITLG